MKIFLQTYMFLMSFFFISMISKAQENKQEAYYQSIDLSAETPCKCNEKTQRTYDLAKGLITTDVLDYEMHAYRFKFANSTVPVSKLFKAMENDPTIHKVSMKEWDSFMLLTTKDFDVQSFEIVANKIFAEFSEMQPLDFLKTKNQEVYEKYLSFTSSNPK